MKMKNPKSVPKPKKEKPDVQAKVPAVKKLARKASAAVQEKTYFGLQNLSPAKGSRKKKKILGRGPSSGHGKTSTRGSKGQTSRSGRDFYLGFEGGQTPLIRRIPKRGFTNIFKKEYQIVNLEGLKRIKETLITPQILQEKNLIKDKNKLIKILGDGQINNAVTVQAHAVSKKALDKIQAAGGKVELINV